MYILHAVCVPVLSAGRVTTAGFVPLLQSLWSDFVMYRIKPVLLLLKVFIRSNSYIDFEDKVEEAPGVNSTGQHTSKKSHWYCRSFGKLG